MPARTFQVGGCPHRPSTKPPTEPARSPTPPHPRSTRRSPGQAERSGSRIVEELASGAQSSPQFIAQFATSARGTELGPKARAFCHRDDLAPWPPERRVLPLSPLHYALGQYLEDDADFAAPSPHSRRPTTYFRKPLTSAAAQTDDVIDSFPIASPRLPRSAHDDRTRIVGMPHSGTTLLERILGGHPDAAGVGELDTLPILAALPIPARLGVSTYSYRNLDGTTPALMNTSRRRIPRLDPLAHHTDARRVIDKMPHNFMHVGLIALTLPGASIIHNRRHPLDTCLSCYTTWLRASHDYAVSLRGLAAAYRNSHRLMNHWSALFGDRIVQSVYEETIADTEGSAALFARSASIRNGTVPELPFSRGRRHHRQRTSGMHKPIYATSTNRWKNYEPFIGELIDTALGDLL